jgi:hypothetical protein
MVPMAAREGESVMPRYLCLYKSAQPEGTPPSAEEQAKMGALIGEMFQAGVLVSTEGCLPSKVGFRVRQDKGKVTVTDARSRRRRRSSADWPSFRRPRKRRRFSGPRSS